MSGRLERQPKRGPVSGRAATAPVPAVAPSLRRPVAELLRRRHPPSMSRSLPVMNAPSGPSAERRRAYFIRSAGSPGRRDYDHALATWPGARWLGRSSRGQSQRSHFHGDPRGVIIWAGWQISLSYSPLSVDNRAQTGRPTMTRILLALGMAATMFAVFISSGYAQRDSQAPPAAAPSCPGQPAPAPLATGVYTQKPVAEIVINGQPAPGAIWKAGDRAFWHCHTGGQLLFLHEGVGRVQQRGQRARMLHKGETEYPARASSTGMAPIPTPRRTSSKRPTPTARRSGWKRSVRTITSATTSASTREMNSSRQA
jgi:hypothetical protein